MQRLARCRHRILAFIIDNLIVSLMCLLINIRTMILVIGILKNEESPDMVYLVFQLLITGGIIILIAGFYYLFIPMIFRGQTLGKKVMEIKIVKEDGNDIDFTSLFLREMVGRIIIDLFSFGLAEIISFFVMLLSENHRTFYDSLANTMVIDIKDIGGE